MDGIAGCGPIITNITNIIKGECITDKFIDDNINGIKFKYHLTYSAIKDDGDNLIGATLSGCDIADKRDSTRAKENFLSNISHELRTPLNAILGFSQLIEYDINLKDNIRTYIDSINRSGKYLLSLINNILDLNKINENMVTLTYEPIHVVTKINDICSDLRILTNNKNISLIIDLAGYEDVYIRADRQRYKQIITNIISNAIKYNKNMGQVVIKGSIDKNKFFIDIKDTGIGISEAHLKNIGLPFNRLGNEASDIEGSGLGLTITKNLINIMNGEFRVKSVIGEGSIFSAGFEIAKYVKSNINRKNIDPIIEIEPNKNFTGKILYIEDNNFNLFLMEKIINRYFPNATYCYELNGISGYKKAVEYSPDILLIDVNLSDVSGIEILKKIREDSACTSKIIIITANLTDDVYNESMKYKCDGFITKPVIIHDFVKLLTTRIEE
jgi:nitrogen-specific signal transduction histidine kinase/ActR/RegA family two-component response regulator